MSSLTEKPPRLCVKENNCSMGEHCAICGRWDKAPIGPAIFVEGTWNFVCDDCAQATAPWLVEAVSAWQREEARRVYCGGDIPKSLGGRADDGFDTDFWAEALG